MAKREAKEEAEKKAEENARKARMLWESIGNTRPETPIIDIMLNDSDGYRQERTRQLDSLAYLAIIGINENNRFNEVFNSCKSKAKFLEWFLNPNASQSKNCKENELKENCREYLENPIVKKFFEIMMDELCFDNSTR